MSRRKALASKRRKLGLAQWQFMIQEWRFTPWPGMILRDVYGLSMSHQNVMRCGGLAAARAEFER